MKLNKKELSRADNTGHTIAVRKQTDGTYLVMFVKVSTGEIKSQQSAETKEQIGSAVAYVLRWEDKLGSESKMASCSRERNYCSPEAKKILLDSLPF